MTGGILDISDATAVVSLVVAALSALYARWAWSEAKKANQISLHQHQKAIYDAFFELKMHMTQKWDGAETSSVSKFYYPSKNAVFYFDKPLADEIAKYFTVCFRISDSNRGKVTPEKRIELTDNARDADELAQSIEKQLIKVVTVV
ncbi:hypothetical protein [Vibrio cholerae]|uniref:hypothetical protein n=1 Tax=Vibrio cholerae TaxID=666 RepID=UPI003967AC49|nr:hypothetical protein [Vibrio cholerae]